MPLRRGPPPAGFLAAFLVVAGIFAVKIGAILIVGLSVVVIGTFAWTVVRGRVDRIGLLLLLNLSLWLGSGLLFGGISLGDLTTPGYYQEEGRIFLYYLPLAYFLVAVAHRDALRALTKGLHLLSYLAGALLVVWLVFSPRMLSIGLAQDFVGLTTSHTGAGNVFGALAVFLVLSGLSTGNRRLIVAGVIAALAMFGSASRQAIVALGVTGAWYVIVHGGVRTTARAVTLAGVLTALLVTVTPYSFERLTRVVRPDAASTFLATLRTADWEPGARREVDSSEDANVLTRMLLWGHANRLFLRSPVFGVGFGRYNDEGVQYTRIVPGLTLGLEGRKRTELMSAHNSYIHIAAELGLFGLGLLLVMWMGIYQRLRIATAFFADDSEASGYCLAAQGVVVFTLVGALFGHGLAAPAIGFMVLPIAGLALAVHRSERRMPPEAEGEPQSTARSIIRQG